MSRPPVEGASLRPVTDADAEALVRLIGAIYAEHPGCVLDLPGVDADLTAPRTAIDAKRGDLWVVEREGLVVACCGWAPTGRVEGRDAVELKRLYVRADVRGVGLGAWLVEQVEQVARERGAGVVELWSDSRFTDAHRLYARLGYGRRDETRELHDPSDTTELRYVKHL